MATTNHGGYTESEQKIQERWSRLTFEAAKVETCLRQTSEEEADRLHELIVTCDTDPAHILNTELEPWQIEAEAQAQAAEARRREARGRPDGRDHRPGRRRQQGPGRRAARASAAGSWQAAGQPERACRRSWAGCDAGCG